MRSFMRPKTTIVCTYVLVVMNMSAQPETLALSTAELRALTADVRTLATSASELSAVTSVQTVTLPPYSSWVAEVGNK